MRTSTSTNNHLTRRDLLTPDEVHALDADLEILLRGERARRRPEAAVLRVGGVRNAMGRLDASGQA